MEARRETYKNDNCIKKEKTRPQLSIDGPDINWNTK